MSEFIYVLENPSMPGLVKIGRTERSVSERVGELSSHTGVPTEFVLVKEYAVTNSAEAERLVHLRLSACRVSDNREFFRIGTSSAIAMIESLLGSPWTTSVAPPPIPRRPKPVAVASTPLIGNYQLPSIELLQPLDTTGKPTESKEHLLANARLLQETLAQFEIEVALGDITRGPTITRYELHPAPGVRLEAIAELSNNLAAVLQTEEINILVPVPGKSSVGIEVPNPIKTKVIVRDLFETEEWRNSKARIPLALGMDMYGHPIIADLGEMPHLLIGGGLGSGKSVFLDTLITSLLYRFLPDQLRLQIIDAAGFELQLYNALPHLIAPVISDVSEAILALRWVVNEMDKRYQIFARVGVRKLAAFNGRPKKKPLARKETEAGREGFAVEVDEEIVVPRDEDIIIPEKLSYVVVIIDNLESLMRVAKSEVESALDRLTRQDAHAAGIHLVLTARHAGPDTISETIKGDIPARVAFRCASPADSHSILRTAGAEKLLGQGDMLYLPPGSAQLIRVQGAHITDKEISRIVEFIGLQVKPSWDTEVRTSVIEENEEGIQQCIDVIRAEKKASVSLLHRRLQFDYSRAALIMDELERRGIVGPYKGADRRDVLIDLDASSGGAPVEPPPILQPCLVVSVCEHCAGKFEFDANEFGDRQNVSIPCPHCGDEVVLTQPSSD